MQLTFRSGLVCYGAVKLLLLAFFLVSLGYAQAIAARDTSACAGRDLVELYSSSKPDELAKIRAQAARTVNGNAYLWKITKPGIDDSFLFGTMHIADKRVSVMSPAVRLAFEKSHKVLVEITDMLDSETAQATMSELMHLTFRTDGSTIDGELSPTQLVLLKAAISERGVPFELASRMQPWMLAPIIAQQLCEIDAKSRGELYLDAKIMNMAVKAGKPLVALETTKQQLSAIASMPRTFQIASIVETLELGDKLNDIKETMKSLYASGDIAMVIPMVRHISGEIGTTFDVSEFQDKLVVQRNQRMVERAEEHLSQGGVFIAVGALHLPGDGGIVALLKNSGYQLQPVNTLPMTD